MSIYHCNISNVSRAAGSSSCATLSYISGVAIHEDRTNQNYSYGRAERVVLTGTIIPPGAPAEFRNPETLFNAIEDYEKAANARPAKKIEIALPREFDLQTSRDVVEDYIKRNLSALGYAATYAIHHDADGRNPHAHILVANRQINPKTGEWGGKRKMIYALDADGNRVPLIDKKTGQQKVDSHGRKAWKRINAEVNPLDEKSMLKTLRQSWAEVCNERLQPADHIDARSYADQGKEQIPTVHEGYAARAMAERGEVSERVELNKQIREANAELMRIAAARQTCYANLVILKQEQAEAARAAAKAAEEKRQQEGADALEKIQRLFDPDYDKHQKEAEERQRQEAAARAAEEKRQQEQRRQAAAEAERQQEDQRYEQYWNDRLGGLDWRELDQFCKTEYHDRYCGAMSEAWQMYVRQNIGQITDYFTQQRDQVRADIADWKRKNPEPPQPEPRAPLYKRFFYTYQNSEGTTYKDKDYHIYKSAQEAIRSRWDCDFEKVQKPITRAEQELQYCKERNITKIIETLENDYRDGHMFYYSKPRHGTLYNMIAEGAHKLIETLKEFAPVRAMVKVVNALAHDRAEERRQDLQRERERQRQQNRSQGRGGYSR